MMPKKCPICHASESFKWYTGMSAFASQLPEQGSAHQLVLDWQRHAQEQDDSLKRAVQLLYAARHQKLLSPGLLKEIEDFLPE